MAQILAQVMGILLILLTKKIDDPIITEDVADVYDFIVVGAGTTGSVVASRLSEIHNISVLLLEAGPSDQGNAHIPVPSSVISLLGSSIDWGYTIQPQKYAIRDFPGRVGQWPRGKVLGGTSSMSAVMYIRGSPHDYNSWESHGAEGWGWEAVLPFFKRVERAMGEDVSSRMGRDGQLKISKAYTTPISETMKEAGMEIGLQEVDYMANLEGVANAYINTYEGMRQSSATAYLRGVFPERKHRLHIVTGAHVTKLLFGTEGKSKKNRAVGVEFVKDGITMKVKARKEIVLSSGTIGTPKILLQSGIGPKDHLADFNIDLIEDLPGVGSNLQDQNMIRTFFTVKNPPKDDIKDPNLEYILKGSGPLSIGWGLDTVIHARSKYAKTPISLSTAKHPFPDLQIMFFNRKFPVETPTVSEVKNGMADIGMAIDLQHPKSRGTIRLKSKNPLEQPAIDPMYFSNHHDVMVLTEGLRLMEKLEMSDAFRKTGIKMIVPTSCNGSEHVDPPRSADYYRCMITGQAYTAFHTVGTAKIGADDDAMAVVDSRLKVRGVTVLRVADASVMPHELSTNPQATCFMIGEKAAHMVKEDWNMLPAYEIDANHLVGAEISDI